MESQKVLIRSIWSGRKLRSEKKELSLSFPFCFTEGSDCGVNGEELEEVGWPCLCLVEELSSN